MINKKVSIRCGFHEVSIDSRNGIVLPKVFTKNEDLQKYDLFLLNAFNQKCLILCDSSQLEHANERWGISEQEVFHDRRHLRPINPDRRYRISLNDTNLNAIGASSDKQAYRGKICVVSLVDHVRVYHPVDWHSDNLPFSL